jgi:hypothetical protein
MKNRDEATTMVNSGQYPLSGIFIHAEKNEN